MNQRLKQRMVGAVVLVALAVIFVPMLLTGPVQQEAIDVPLAIPPQPQVTVPAAPAPGLPLNDEQAPALTDSRPLETVPAPAEVDTPPRPQTPAPAPAPTPAPQPKPTVPAVAEPARQTPPELATWTVQVASFSDQARAVAMRDQLRKKDYPAYIETATADGQRVYRVRVGPMVQRAQAEAMRDKLAKSEQLQGQVRPHP